MRVLPRWYRRAITTHVLFPLSVLSRVQFLERNSEWFYSTLGRTLKSADLCRSIQKSAQYHSKAGAPNKIQGLSLGDQKRAVFLLFIHRSPEKASPKGLMMPHDAPCTRKCQQTHDNVHVLCITLYTSSCFVVRWLRCRWAAPVVFWMCNSWRPKWGQRIPNSGGLAQHRSHQSLQGHFQENI